MKSSNAKEALGDDSMEVTYEDEAAASQQDQTSSQQNQTKRFKQTTASSSQPLAETVSHSESFWSQKDGGLIYHDGNGFMFSEIGIENSTRWEHNKVQFEVFQRKLHSE